MKEVNEILKVAIIQDYIPSYRVDFFSQLRDSLRSQNVEVNLYVLRDSDQATKRKDGGQSNLAVMPISAFKLPLPGSRNFVLRNVVNLARKSDLVIAEQAIRNLDTWLLLLCARFGGPKVALWGHGKVFTQPTSSIEKRLLKIMTNLAAWLFAYTDVSAEAVESQGFNRARVTVVDNAIPVEYSSSKFPKPKSADDEFKFVFLGALDKSKRLKFLLDSFDLIRVALVNAKLTIAGDGPEKAWLESAVVDRPYVALVPNAQGPAKTQLLRDADALLMPGRVGLIAVESFHYRVPVFTTSWQYHAPEFSYLQDGYNSLVTGNSLEEYASGVIEGASDAAKMKVLKSGCSISSKRYTLPNMVAKFSRGVMEALDA